MNRLNVAIVGTGGIYRLAHGPAWTQIPRASVVATCDIVKERAEQASSEFDAAKAFSSMDEMLRDDGIDLVDICTPHPTHAALAIQALDAGKHVICEKPMALDLGEAARMIQVATANNRHLYIGHTRRFDRRWIQVKELLQAGRIGQPVAARWSERSWAGFSSDSWRWDPRNGGVLMDLGVHVADLFAWFFDAAPTEVYAKTLSVRPEAQQSSCPDFAVVEISFRGRQQGLMELSWGHPKGYASYYSSLELIGTKGKLTLSDRDSAPMTVVKDDIGVPRYSPLLSTFPEAFVGELAHFVDGVSGAASARITPQEAYRAVEVVVKALESAATGLPVSLNGVPKC